MCLQEQVPKVVSRVLGHDHTVDREAHQAALLCHADRSLDALRQKTRLVRRNARDVVEPAVDPVFFKVVPDERMRTKEFLSRFIGKYSFQEDAVEIQLKGEDTIVLAPPRGSHQILVPIRGMRFGIEGAGTTTITFVEDDSGEITEFQFREGVGFFAQFLTAKKIGE